LEYENFIKRYIYIFLLGWHFSFRCATIQCPLLWERGTFKRTTPKKKFIEVLLFRIILLGLAEYLANIISIISNSLELLFERFFAKKKKKKKKYFHYQECWRRTVMAKGIVAVLEVLVNFHQYTFTNSTVPNTEPTASNSTFWWSFLCGSRGRVLVNYHTIYFKEVYFFALIF